MLLFRNQEKRGKGLFFGFVRFGERKYVLKSIEALNGSSFKGHKLTVKLASFGWRERRPRPIVKEVCSSLLPRGEAFPPRSSYEAKMNYNAEVRSPFEAKMSSKAEFRSPGGKSGKSYVEVVKKTLQVNQDRWVLGLVFKENAGGLSNSLVGSLRWEGAISLVKGLCIECGLESVKIARLGGVLVLLSFDDLEKAFPIINNFEQEFLHYFSALERWRPGVLNPVQFVRVRCFGVPLHIWSTQTFENICGMFGEVVGALRKLLRRRFLFMVGSAFVLRVTS